MQKFIFPLTPEDRKSARRAGQIAVVIYFSVALALVVGTVVHIELKKIAPNSATAQAPVDAGQKDAGARQEY